MADATVDARNASEELSEGLSNEYARSLYTSLACFNPDHPDIQAFIRAGGNLATGMLLEDTTFGQANDGVVIIPRPGFHKTVFHRYASPTSYGVNRWESSDPIPFGAEGGSFNTIISMQDIRHDIGLHCFYTGSDGTRKDVRYRVYGRGRGIRRVDMYDREIPLQIDDEERLKKIELSLQILMSRFPRNGVTSGRLFHRLLHF